MSKSTASVATLITRTTVAVLLAVAVMPAIGWKDQAHASPAWLEALNGIRTQAGLVAVTEDPALSAADAQHVNWMIANSELSHFETPGTPGYTPSGDAAGRRSNICFGCDGAQAIDAWMTAPFHALGLLAQDLRSVGFATAKDANGLGWSALDVQAGRDPAAALSWPRTWPADGTTDLRYNRYSGHESPDPLTACPDYAGLTTVGLPLIVSLGPDAEPSSALTATLTNAAGQVLPNCVATMAEYGYGSGDGELFIIPRSPLEPGERYTAQLAEPYQAVRFTFTTARHATRVDLYDPTGGTAVGWGEPQTFRIDVVDTDTRAYLPGVTVELLAARGAEAEQVVASGISDTQGHLELRHAAERAGTWSYRARLTGTSRYLPAVSDGVAATIVPAETSLDLTELSPTGVLYSGSSVQVRGQIRARRGDLSLAPISGRTVGLWARGRSAGAAWRQVATFTSHSDGRFAGTVRLFETGDLQLRYAGWVERELTSVSDLTSRAIRMVFNRCTGGGATATGGWRRLRCTLYPGGGLTHQIHLQRYSSRYGWQNVAKLSSRADGTVDAAVPIKAGSSAYRFLGVGDATALRGWSPTLMVTGR